MPVTKRGRRPATYDGIHASRRAGTGTLKAHTALSYHFHRRAGVTVETAMSQRHRKVKRKPVEAGQPKKPDKYVPLGHDVPVLSVKIHFEADIPRAGHPGKTIHGTGESFRKRDYDILNQRLTRVGFSLVMPKWGTNGPEGPIRIVKTKRKKLLPREVEWLVRKGIDRAAIPKRFFFFPLSRNDVQHIIDLLSAGRIAFSTAELRRLNNFEMTDKDVEKVGLITEKWNSRAHAE